MVHRQAVDIRLRRLNRTGRRQVQLLAQRPHVHLRTAVPHHQLENQQCCHQGNARSACLGSFSPVYIAQEVRDNRFKIAGGTPGQKISWLVIGRRNDPYLQQYDHPVEQAKPAAELGTYLYPDLYDQPDQVMTGLRNLAFRGNDVIVFHLLDPMELSFDFERSAQFVDMETREEMHVIPDYLRQEYRRIIRDQIAFFEKECQKDRIDYALIDTSQPMDSALATYLLRRERLY